MPASSYSYEYDHEVQDGGPTPRKCCQASNHIHDVHNPNDRWRCHPSSHVRAKSMCSIAQPDPHHRLQVYWCSDVDYVLARRCSWMVVWQQKCGKTTDYRRCPSKRKGQRNPRSAGNQTFWALSPGNFYKIGVIGARDWGSSGCIGKGQGRSSQEDEDSDGPYVPPPVRRGPRSH